MKREKAIKYLQKKGKIKYSQKEEKEINKVIKSGKIYGDPIVELY